MTIIMSVKEECRLRRSFLFKNNDYETENSPAIYTFTMFIVNLHQSSTIKVSCNTEEIVK